MRVLVAEDSLSLRRIEREILVRMGFDDVAEAENGRQALELAKAQPPDLLLVDREMPEVDGVEVVRTLRSRGFAGPIVMVSTTARRDEVLAAIAAGVTCYVLKPFTPNVLTDRIRDAIARSRAA